MEPEFAADWAQAPDDATRLRVVVDQVASLTDTSARAWAARLL
jgi:dGTPase